MKPTTALAVAVVAGLLLVHRVSSADPPHTEQCEPGTKVTVGCNTCTCNMHGMATMCTMSEKDCSSHLPGEACPGCEPKS